MIRLLITGVFLLTALPFQDKTAVPPAAAQKEAETLIKGIFKDEYAKRTPEAQVALARKLLQQGRETRDDAAARYVLLREAVDLSSKNGDLALALEAVKETAQHYDVDQVTLQAKLLTDVPAAFKTPEQARTFAQTALTAAGEMAALDRTDEAKRVLARAEAAAKAGKDLALMNRVQKRRKDIDALQVEAQKLKAAEATLQTNADDPPANLSMGRYLAAKGKLDQAMTHFVKGSDPALKAAADKDLAAPKEAQAQVQAGNAWFDAAEKEGDGPIKQAFQGRAREWFESAIGGSNGLARLAIEKRLEALDNASAGGPPPPPVPPSLRVIPYAAFEAMSAQYPPDENIAAKFGKATASSHYEGRLPDDVFKGNRRSNAWTLSTASGWFEAKWDPPVRGRTLVMIGRNSAGEDAWGQATLTLNGTIKLPIQGMAGGTVIIVELGAARRLESLRADIKGASLPGLASVEVFR